MVKVCLHMWWNRMQTDWPTYLFSWFFLFDPFATDVISIEMDRIDEKSKIKTGIYV